MSDSAKNPKNARLDADPAELAEAVETASGYPEPAGGRPPKDVSKPVLMRLVHTAEQERARMVTARRDAEAEAERARAARLLAEEGVAQLAQREAEMTTRLLEREQTYLAELRVQVERTADLANTIEQLRADSGNRLSAERDGALEVLEKLGAEAESEAGEVRARAREEADRLVAAAREEAAKIREQADEQSREQRAALDAEITEADSQRKALARRVQEIERREAAVEMSQRLAAEEARDQVTVELATLRRQLDDAKAELQTARRERGDAEAEAERLRARAERSGEKSKREMQQDLEQHRVWLSEARAELDRRPPLSAIDELEAARARADASEKEADALRSRLAKAETAETERRRLSAAVVDLEQEREEAEQRQVRLQRRIADLRAELELLGDASGAEAPDKDLIDIDRESRQRSAEGISERRTALSAPELLREVRARMAAAGRYYAEGDVRIFLAGLAASRLHILEGISGTGKTSLPIAFTRAVGGFHEVVEVQAAWRDRIDLLGSYNAFDRRYYPTDFARAVYRAGTPGWRDTICVIVIDEMNLAHPEHYFADVLSAMESGKERLEALPRAIGVAEALLDRRNIPIGPNVWFIGTANRDETTTTIADKTYDRANLMELPARFSEFPVGDPGADEGAIPYSVLDKLFTAAAAERQSAADAVLRVARDDDLLRASAHLRIGFGNRLDRIVRRFAPTFVAMQGSQAEALDHILATKLVRKLESRFEAKPQHLDAFGTALAKAAGAELEEMPRTKREFDRQVERLTA